MEEFASMGVYGQVTIIFVHIWFGLSLELDLSHIFYAPIFTCCHSGHLSSRFSFRKLFKDF